MVLRGIRRKLTGLVVEKHEQRKRFSTAALNIKFLSKNLLQNIIPTLLAP